MTQMTGMTRRGNLFVISAPSGSGKTTLVRRLLDTLDDVQFSISFTTRSVRDSERDGVDYHFIGEADFRSKIEDGEFLEWAEVHENLYGTSKIETEKIRAGGEDILMDVDVQGATQVRKAQPDAVTLFIMPPSFGVLEERLRGRRQDSDKVIEGRLVEARHEIHHYKDYDYVLVNDSVERTSELFKAIVLSERMRPHLLQDRIRPIVDTFKE